MRPYLTLMSSGSERAAGRPDEWTPTGFVDTSDPTGHHGWDIIRTLANGWGFEGDSNTRTVWARFDWSK